MVQPLSSSRKNCYFLDSSKDTFLNSFNAFSNSNEALRARVPAALFPFEFKVNINNPMYSSSLLLFYII